MAVKVDTYNSTKTSNKYDRKRHSLHDEDDENDFLELGCSSQNGIIDLNKERIESETLGSTLSAQDPRNSDEWLNFEIPDFEAQIRAAQTTQNHQVETLPIATSDGKTIHMLHGCINIC